MWERVLFVLLISSNFSWRNKSFVVLHAVAVEATEFTFVNVSRSAKRFRSFVHSWKVSKNLKADDQVRAAYGVVHPWSHLSLQGLPITKDKRNKNQRELALASRATVTSSLESRRHGRYSAISKNNERGGSGGSGGGSATTSNALSATLNTGTPSFETYDCKNQEHYYDDDGIRWPPNCTLIANSTDRVNTTDEAVNEAHNYAIDVYTFYKNMFNRNSWDGLGMPVRSFVHYGVNNGEAHYSVSMLGPRYGDGDNIMKLTCYDSVAFACSEGVNIFSANLQEHGESGALYNSLLDIMAAAIARLVHKRS